MSDLRPLAASLFRLATEYPDVMTVSTGTLSAGVVADVATIGGTTVDVTEVVGAPGFDIVFDWTSAGGVPRRLDVVGYYLGGGNHAPTLQAYDYVAAGWTTLETFYDAIGLHSFSSPLNGSFISAGAMSVRFYHSSNGNGTHHMYIDYVGVEMGMG